MKSVKMLVLILFLASGVALVWRFWGVAAPFFAAAILAFLLGPIVNRMCRSGKVRRGLAVAFVLFVTVTLIGLLLGSTMPYIVTQVGSLLRDLSGYASNLDELTARALEWLEALHLPDFLLQKIAELLANVDSYLTQVFTAILSWLVSFSTGLVDIVIVVILVVYFLLDGRKLIRSVLRKLPLDLSARCERILRQADTLTWKYLRARVIISGGMAVVTYLGLTIMGIRYAVVFAALSFVLDFVPYFGSLLAGVIEAVYALVTGGLGLAIGVVVFVLVVQQIEGNIVAPKVQADAVGLHPVVVLFALLACNEILGPVGMLISTPIACIVKVVYSEVYSYLTVGLDTPERAARRAAAASGPAPEAPVPPPAQAEEAASGEPPAQP